MHKTQDLNVLSTTPLITPRELKSAVPMTEKAGESVVAGRAALHQILRGESGRMLAVVGPCSIHDHDAAIDYARRLKHLAGELERHLFIVMRAYFGKPRTTIGWKGLINDPHLDGSYDMATGLRKAREILIEIAELGLPAGTEMLDPIVPQYLADTVTWAAIGARTTESQTHREMASGLSMPVGFKNSTDGNLQVAIDAMNSARQPHHFLGIDADGHTCVVATRGNAGGHVILRGGRGSVNYDPVSIAEAEEQMRKSGLEPLLVVDCSHANSGKRSELQRHVLRSVLQQRLDGTNSLIGFMLESNLYGGKQPMPDGVGQLRYGVSITDACISWETTEKLLRYAHDELARGDAPNTAGQ